MLKQVNGRGRNILVMWLSLAFAEEKYVKLKLPTDNLATPNALATFYTCLHQTNQIMAVSFVLSPFQWWVESSWHNTIKFAWDILNFISHSLSGDTLLTSFPTTCLCVLDLPNIVAAFAYVFLLTLYSRAHNYVFNRFLSSSHKSY
jgi:hypothetical protein